MSAVLGKFDCHSFLNTIPAFNTTREPNAISCVGQSLLFIALRLGKVYKGRWAMFYHDLARGTRNVTRSWPVLAADSEYEVMFLSKFLTTCQAVRLGLMGVTSRQPGNLAKPRT
jgi:hypothetical protein